METTPPICTENKIKKLPDNKGVTLNESVKKQKAIIEECDYDDFRNIVEQFLISISKEGKFKSSAKKRALNVIIELVENVRRHRVPTDDLEEKASLLLQENTDGDKKFIIKTSNTVNKDDKKVLKERLKKVQEIFDTTAPEELKDVLRKTLTNILEHTEINEKGGASLGYFSIANRTKQPPKYSFKKLPTGNYIFNLEIHVSIEQEDK